MEGGRKRRRDGQREKKERVSQKVTKGEEGEMSRREKNRESWKEN